MNIEIIEPGVLVVTESSEPQNVGVLETKTDLIVIHEGPKGPQGDPGTGIEIFWNSSQW